MLPPTLEDVLAVARAVHRGASVGTLIGQANACRLPLSHFACDYLAGTPEPATRFSPSDPASLDALAQACTVLSVALRHDIGEREDAA